jgi:hypothetical protein
MRNTEHFSDAFFPGTIPYFLYEFIKIYEIISRCSMSKKNNKKSKFDH